MKRAKILLALLMILTLMFAAGAGCTDPAMTDGDTAEPAAPDTSGADADISEPAGQPAEDPPQPPGQNPSAEGLVSVDFATDELMSGFEMFLVEEKAGDENAIRIIIMPAVPLKDFKFTEIDFREEDDDIVFFEKSVIFTTDELLPEWPFVTAVDFFGTFPTRGISFVDEDNLTRHFAIAESGNDGSLFLIEFQE